MRTIFSLLIFGLLVGSTVKYTRTISGFVTDSLTLQPLEGVSVMAGRVETITVTDARGYYKLPLPDDAQRLVFFRTGYQAKEVDVAEQKTVDVKLVGAQKVMYELLTAPMRSERLASGRPMQYISISSEQILIPNTEDYNAISETGFRDAQIQPVTTFSVDVDRAAYGNIRRYLTGGNLPPKDAVRIEEMVNYFDYDDPQPGGNDPVAVKTELSESPWNPGLHLLRIGLQAKTIPTDNLPASNLVFLIDVSGSMRAENKLPLVKAALNLLVDQLRSQDRVALVVYAGAAGLVLPSTPGSERQKIKDAINQLTAEGSTAGGEGIRLAYQIAQENFRKDGNNRVILATDGDFNVGVSSDGDLQRLIEEKRKSGVFLSVLGFGMGNYKDNKLEILADKGNGNYAYIDNLPEAQKVFGKEFGGTLFTVAKDVKLQLEFNPRRVRAYRLIGYENRTLNNEDFHNDQKDAGEMGPGHTVTALYEIIPAGVKSRYLPQVDPLKYQRQAAPAGASNELLTLKIRYKKPDSETSQQRTQAVKFQPQKWANTSDDFRFAAAVAEFGLLLRDSEFKGRAHYSQVATRARQALGRDPEGYRSEFIRLVKLAQYLSDEGTLVKKSDRK
ncbi:Ca-activated chloride channel family protein [Larkinella arboricola]|uniref:Ca-activated chloride channel family protein n=1 Tax=Larkinella arboricola TaxID=643671 RepID=A0A327XCQ5_LARAB|nr:von Willebrand factor type A domain-containing protein [Larkinella arboricola]RAK02056.1 Ca-activated chloride channel family protein [Larkinella arboricola]